MAEIVAEALAEVKRRHGEHRGMQVGVFGLDDLGGDLPFLAAVEAGEVEVVPVEGDLAPEVGAVAEGFAVKELVFLEAVDGFDVALPGDGAGGDVVVSGTEGAPIRRPYHLHFHPARGVTMYPPFPTPAPLPTCTFGLHPQESPQS